MSKNSLFKVTKNTHQTAQTHRMTSRAKACSQKTWEGEGQNSGGLRKPKDSLEDPTVSRGSKTLELNS